MIKRFKSWSETRRIRIAKAILADMIKKKDAEIYDQLRSISKIMAMQELDKARITHCHLCPVIVQLRKDPQVKGAYLCQEHYNLKLVEESEKKEELIVV